MSPKTFLASLMVFLLVLFPSSSIRGIPSKPKHRAEAGSRREDLRQSSQPQTEVANRTADLDRELQSQQDEMEEGVGKGEEGKVEDCSYPPKDPLLLAPPPAGVAFVRSPQLFHPQSSQSGRVATAEMNIAQPAEKRFHGEYFSKSRRKKDARVTAVATAPKPSLRAACFNSLTRGPNHW
jgi:hypothetical protein